MSACRPGAARHASRIGITPTSQTAIQNCILPARWRKSCSKAQAAFERFPSPAVARGEFEETALPRGAACPRWTCETAFRLGRNYPEQNLRAGEIRFAEPGGPDATPRETRCRSALEPGWNYPKFPGRPTWCRPALQSRIYHASLAGSVPQQELICPGQQADVLPRTSARTAAKTDLSSRPPADIRGKCEIKRIFAAG